MRNACPHSLPYSHEPCPSCADLRLSPLPWRAQRSDEDGTFEVLDAEDNTVMSTGDWSHNCDGHQPNTADAAVLLQIINDYFSKTGRSR